MQNRKLEELTNFIESRKAEGKIRYISKTQWYVVNYENIYRLCYIHGAEGILI